MGPGGFKGFYVQIVCVFPGSVGDLSSLPEIHVAVGHCQPSLQALMEMLVVLYWLFNELAARPAGPGCAPAPRTPAPLHPCTPARG